MRRPTLVAVVATLSLVALAVPAASSANDARLGAAICSWNHALTNASKTAPNLQKNDFGQFKSKAVAWARLIVARDAALRHALQKTNGSSATGKRVRTAMLASILPGLDAGARMVISGAGQHPDRTAAKTMGTGIGKVLTATFGMLKIPGLFTWAPKGCFS